MKPSPLLEQNLRTLRVLQPLLARKIEERLSAWKDLPEPQIREVRNGRWISGLSPVPFFQHPVEARRDKRLARKSLFLLLGVGAPPYLFHRFRSLPKGTLGVVVFEPNLDLLIHTLNLTSVYLAAPEGCHLSFLVSADAPDIREAMDVNIRPMGSYIVADAEFLLHDGETEAFGGVFREMRDGFLREVRAHIDLMGNSPEDTLLGFRQMVLNLPWLLTTPDLGALAEHFRGVPFICVASGPSLEKNLHLLRGVEDRCVIIAADTVLRRLLVEGIRPHVVVTLERPVQMYNKYFRPLVEEHAEACRNILLLSQGVSPPQIPGRWPGPKAVVGKMEVPVDRWFMHSVLKSFLLRSGMSVAHMALVVAAMWGATQVALVGQDLAFGDEGQSHAELTADASARALEKKRGQEGGFEVPGSLGGTVRTTNIWFLFIKVFERFIPDLRGVTVHDCTEGGALIRGTEVRPLAEFLERFVLSRESLETTPGTLVARAQRECAPDIAGVRGRIARSLEEIRACGAALDDIGAAVERVVAPGLAPERRRQIAGGVATDLDRVHATNPVLGFIGQSYANLAGVVMARTRWLETVAEVEEWARMQREILQAHRVNVAFLDQWLCYADALIGVLLEEIGESPERGVPLPPLDNGEAADRFPELLRRLAVEGGEMRSSSMARLNLLVARSDAGLPPWTAGERWGLALFLHAQGRAEEAVHHMERAYGEYDGKELPTEQIVAFLKDYARIVATHDLCFVPRYRLARTLLDNARRYAPEDPELPALTEQMLQGLQGYLDDLLRSGMVGKPEVDFEARRIAAEKLLNAGNLPATFVAVWHLVLDFEGTKPHLVRPFLLWLVKTVTNCLDAADPAIQNAAEAVAEGMLRRVSLFSRLRVPLSQRLLERFNDAGLKISVASAEEKNGSIRGIPEKEE